MLALQRGFLFGIFSLFLTLSVAYAANEDQSADHQKKSYRVLTLADIHFDPFLTCHKQSPCPLIDKLVSAPVNQWDDLLKQYDDSTIKYGQDTNTTLFKTVLQKAGETARDQRVVWVMVLGDMLGHHYRRQYRQYASARWKGSYGLFVSKSMSYLSQQLSRAFPNTPLYFAVGNNDSYTGDYSMMVQGQFFNETGKLWSRSLFSQKSAAAMVSSFKYAGFYAVDAAHVDGLRIIVLNSNLFSKKARGRHVAEAVIQQLKWLQDQLARAKSNHQHVVILMHMPEGVDVYLTSEQRLLRLLTLWQQDDIDSYEQILGRYAGIIAGVYSGHLHTEWSGIVDLHHEDVENPPAHGIPSVSPFFGQNPGFKLFDCSMSDHKCPEQTVYRYILSNPLHWQIN